MRNTERQAYKKKKNIIGIMQSVLIIFIVILVVMMMIQIDHLQGTARVINYAGLVRGATQREIKLEITGTQNDELIQYLDDIISGLRYQDGHYDLIRLKDETYREKLDVQSAYWEQLKEEIADVRQKGYENTDIVAMSETYFGMADETVFAAEDYSQQIAEKDFVGRYGGDEFMAVVYNTNKQEIEEMLENLCEKIDKWNRNETRNPISYAHGWALSNEHKNCSMQLLFDRADRYMYENKQLCKKRERYAAKNI